MSNLFAALDSDSDDDRKSKKAPVKAAETAAPKAARSNQRNQRSDRGRGRGRSDRGRGRGRSDRGRGRGGSRGDRGGYQGNRNFGSSNNESRGYPRREREPRERSNNRDRKPRNGPNDKRPIAKKGGAGRANWGTGLEKGDIEDARAEREGTDEVPQEDGAADEADAEPEEVAEPVIEYTLDEYNAMEAERRQNKAAFGALKTRKIESAGYGTVVSRDGTDAVPEESGKYKQNRRKHAGHNKEKQNLAAAFFSGAPKRRQEDDRGDRGGGRGYGDRDGGRGRGRSYGDRDGGRGRGRGRGRGYGGRGASRGRGGYGGRGGYDNNRSNNRNGGYSRGGSSNVPKTTDMSEFPSLG